ncbi:putative ankyrin repeat-containing domain-containing protein [Rosa chinensis]|uniref:Putative ankyrin repeat-containing domain-containing protein n=1 Tax=Rosa chinensis TaxID=74649 RepID=A0A2P6RPF1_ROSCH|nr:putative ankyrin repeat-containing domain-containing protein [Rosa chinensis]
MHIMRKNVMEGFSVPELFCPYMLDIVTMMVSKNPEIIKEVDELGWTPLHYAAFRGNVSAIRSLIKRNSSVAYILDNCGMSALHVAAYGGHIKVMKELIRLRPDTCDLLNHKDQTAVHAAVLGEKPAVIRYILKTPTLAGLVNEADDDGNTPLHLAASIPNSAIMKALARDCKVDKTATNVHHSKAVDIYLGNNIELVRTIDIYNTHRALVVRDSFFSYFQGSIIRPTFRSRIHISTVQFLGLYD